MSIVQIEATDIFYCTLGDQYPCLVMHGGLGLDHTTVSPWLDPLADIFQLVYYDHRSNGRSGRPAIETLTFEQLSLDANALRHVLGYAKTAVVGHSYGGFAALQYALRYPNQVSHLILIDTAPAWDYSDEIDAILEQRVLAPEIANATPPVNDQTLGEYMQIIAPLYFHDYQPQRDADVFGHVIPDFAAYQRGFQLLEDYNLVPQLARIDIPALVLVGRSDFITPPSQAQRMAALLPQATLEVFEASGHFPFVEEPERFSTIVRRWFAQHPIKTD